MRITKLLLPFLLVGLLVWCGVLFWLAPELIDSISYSRESARQRAITENLPNLKQADALSVLLREVSKAVKPAVVEIRVKSGKKDGPRGLSPDDNDIVGSGVIIDRKKGYVVTNNHVISGADQIRVILADRREYLAQWARHDVRTDLAVIKISPDNLLDISWGDSDRMEVGDQVIAVGSPMQLPQTVTFGRISAKGRMMTMRSSVYQNYLQTDAAINHGNSGGPLINMSGEVIGINTRMVSKSGASGGLGLSIPSNMASRVIKQLIEDGRAIRGFIGLEIDDVKTERAARLGLPHTRGALVMNVAPDGPGDRAGVKRGDFILSIDSRPVAGALEFLHLVADIKPGTVVPVEVYRDGEKMILNAKIVRQPVNMQREFERRLD